MGEDSSAGLLEGSHTKSGIPIEHLDYRYVESCKNAKELEKILKVLRSGEEGEYPELVDFTEKKLKEVNPKSKSLRKELPIRTYNDLSKAEKEEITNDLREWMENIDQADKSLKVDIGSVDKLHQNDTLPPLRSTTNNQDTSSQPQQKATVKKNKGSSLPRDYHEWDKFDPDKEIEAMDQKEEKEKRRKQEKTTGNNKEAIPSRLNLENKGETEKSILANREKEKGNEAFQSGQYSEAVAYYSRSIQLDPKTAAAYNNRALAGIKLEQFQQAIEDCNTVLSLEPNNVKAYLRRSIARRGQGRHEEAREDLSHVLAVEPNNKRAKELLGEMDKQKRTEQKQNKSVISDDANNEKDQLTESERTSKNNQGNNLPTENSATTRKGKRLKIVEVEGEPEPEPLQILNHESCAVKESRPPGDESNRLDVISKTTDLQAKVEYSKADQQQLQLPGLVDKAKDEATRLFKLGRYAEAAEKYTEAIDILRKDKLMYRNPLCSLLGNRASCLLRIGDCLGCVSDCTAALELDSGSARSLVKRAEAYETAEKYREAWQDYRSVLRIKPQNITALQGNSRVSRQLERLYGSNWKEQVEPSSSRTSNHSSALQDIGAASPTLLLPPQAANGSPQQLLSGPTESNGTLTQVDGSNGAALSTQPTPPGTGVRDAQSVPHLTPDTKTPSLESRLPPSVDRPDPLVTFSQFKDQGNSLVKQSRFQDAVACYTRCIDIDPNSVAIYTNRALCYLRLDKHELAIEDTSQALRLQPSNVKALFRRALAKKGMGNYDSAARDLFELQKIEPKNAAAKKELEVVLELCRKERRASQEKASEVKKPASKKEAKPPRPKENQPVNEVQWKRIHIKDVQYDEEDEEIADKVPKGPGTLAEETSNQITHNVNAKTVKLTKNTAYDFFQAWNSVKKNNTKGDADLLRQLESNSLAQVLSNKLDAPMFNRIVAALAEEMLPKGEEGLAHDVLKQLCHAQRFDMVLLFLSAKEKNELRHLFSKLEAAKQNFVATAEFESLKKKYKL